MQINILSGIYTDAAPDFRRSYPVNMIPVPIEQGISNGYLRPADGIRQVGTGPGLDRGAINWNGVLYRVMGNNLCRIDSSGTVTTLGNIPGIEHVSMDYSFDRLAIVGGGNLYYWNGTTLTQVTDPDLGIVFSVVWIDGYFMLTDGKSLIVTDLADPTSINPLRYGSSEADPDPINGLLRLSNEVYALNRNTVEVFDDIGGTGFPFQRVSGAQLDRGSIGTHSSCIYMDQIAFVGSTRSESPAVWIGKNSNVSKISTREIDTILQSYSELQLSQSVVETRVDKSHQFLYIHLPDQTLVYDGAASQKVQDSVWYVLSSSVVGRAKYRAQSIIWCYDQWNVGDPTSNAIGVLDDTISTHYGQVIGWEFGTNITYNDSNGAIFHQLELVCLPGRVAFGADPVVWTSYSIDGETWSQEFTCSAGKQGDRLKRITWLRQGHMRNWRIQKFRGTSDSHVAFARLEAQIEALNG